MMESYVRNAPKRHELYQGNLGVRGYACREFGGKCADWYLREALVPNGSAVTVEGSARRRPAEEQKKPAVWQTVTVVGD